MVVRIAAFLAGLAVLFVVAALAGRAVGPDVDGARDGAEPEMTQGGDAPHAASAREVDDERH